MKNILIRQAASPDIEHLVQLENDCFTTDMLSKNSFQHLLKVNSAKVLVAEQNKKIIGSLVIFFRKNSKKARLYSLAVHKDFRKLGIAIALCKQMEETAIKRHCHTLSLEVQTHNHTAIQFYEKLGYEKLAEVKNFYLDSTHAFRMQKTLRSGKERNCNHD